jgi:hypothetical protein
MQHQSITMRFHFFKLYTMRIFLKAADQAKKTTFKGTFYKYSYRERGYWHGDKDIIERIIQ